MSKAKKLNSKFLKGSEIDNMDNVTYLKKQPKRKPQNGYSQFELKEIRPLTDNQAKVFAAYEEGQNIICSGFPGCGKTFLALYLALNDILYGENDIERIIIIRSLVKTREIGHLPGTVEEKAGPFEAPYSAICNELFGRGDAYSILKKKDMIVFENTSFLRGLSFNNSIIIVDELENCNFHELDTIAGRIGKNCRLFLAGDLNQTDLLTSGRDVSGFNKFLKIASIMEEFSIIDFEVQDIVRSGFVYDYIIAKDRIERGYE